MFKNKPLSFFSKLFISLLILSLVVLIFLKLYIWKTTKELLYENLGEKAEVQAKELAVIPSLIKYVEEKNSEKIAELIQSIFKQSDASYIVIGDKHTYRLFHSADRPFSSPMVGDDNQQVLNGNSSISISRGSLGTSLRGKAPIVSTKGEIIGIVSIGYMTDDIYKLQTKQFIPFVFFCGVLFLILFIFSFIFTRSIKKQMLNLEPKEIALLVKTQKSIMESIFESIIAVDLNYKIININRSAKAILGIKVEDHKLINQNLSYIIQSNSSIFNMLHHKQDLHDHICYFDDIIVIASCVCITIEDETQGWVITFRNFDDINLLSMKLTQINQYVDNLRTLRHEHLNWVATLSGLIYMQRYDEAKDFIALQASGNQRNLDFITQRIAVPTIAGLLIGKYAKASEVGLTLILDPSCQLMSLPHTITDSEFMSIVGNLLDNAFNASLNNPNGEKNILLYLSDATDEIVLEVSDQGCGIDKDIRDFIFEPGVTSQNEKEHGIGLHLVSTYTKKAKGYIMFDDNDPCGTIFSVFIPK